MGYLGDLMMGMEVVRDLGTVPCGRYGLRLREVWFSRTGGKDRGYHQLLVDKVVVETGHVGVSLCCSWECLPDLARVLECVCRGSDFEAMDVESERGLA